MGLFYVTTYVHCSDPAPLVAFLQTAQRSAYVLPPQKGFTLVYDEELATQDTQAINTLTQAIARHLACTVLTIANHDDDFLFFSASTNAHDLPVTSASLAALFQKEHLQPLLEQILTDSDRLAGEKHHQLAKMLGLPFAYAQFSFEELREADHDLGQTDPGTVILARRKLLTSLTETQRSKPVTLDYELHQLIKHNKIISAVAHYQQRTGATFQEARAYIDQLKTQRQPK